MIVLILILPLVFLPFLFAGHTKSRFRAVNGLAILHFIMALVLFVLRADPWPQLTNYFCYTPLGSTFILAYTGLQLVSFLSLPRVQTTQRQLAGGLLFSFFAISTICSATQNIFLLSFAASLFVPFLWSLLEGGAIRSAMIFMLLGLACLALTIKGASSSSLAGVLTLNIWILLAASMRLGFFPFHLWVRRMVLRLPLQWSVLYFLSYPSIALFLRARLAQDGLQVNSVFLHMAWITAIYGSWLAIVQRDLRSTFYFLLLSFFGSIGVGLSLSSDMHALSGVLLFWFTAGLALAGFGLTIEMLEARFGRLSFDSVRGLIGNVPILSALFIMFGLGSVGFPGMCAFIGEEVMLSGIYERGGWAVLPILLALSLNGVTVLRWFFAIFFGPETVQAQGIDLLKRERIAFFLLLAIIVSTGLFPGPIFHLGQSGVAATPH